MYVYVIKGNVRPYNPQNKYGFIWHGTSIFGPWQFPLNKGPAKSEIFPSRGFVVVCSLFD
jgi:hypothetical protein